MKKETEETITVGLLLIFCLMIGIGLGEGISQHKIQHGKLQERGYYYEKPNTCQGIMYGNRYICEGENCETIMNQTGIFCEKKDYMECNCNRKFYHCKDTTDEESK